MHLVVVEQLTNNEAAEVMGVSPEAAKSSLSVARATIRRRLADIDAELSPHAPARATSGVRNKE